MVAYAEKNFVHHFIAGEYCSGLRFTEVYWNVLYLVTKDTES